MPSFLALVLLAAGGWGPPPPPPTCYAPYHQECSFVTNVGYRCTCQPPKRPTTQKGQFIPRLLATHVVYAVPGRSSFVSYASGSTLGTQISTSSSWKNEAKVGLKQDAGLFNIASLGFKYEFTAVTGGGSTDATDMSTTVTSTYRKPGEMDGVNHDDDEVWFILKPILDVDITPADPYWGPAHVEWAMDPGFIPTTYYMQLGELNGHYAISSNTQQFLDAWGVTGADLGQLMSLDAFGAQPSLNPANAPNRFTLVGIFPYRPPTVAGYLPTTKTFDVKHKSLSSSQQDVTQAYVTELEVHGSAGFLGMAKVTAYFDDKFTWTASSSHKDYSQLDADDQITIGQPAFDYTGPTVLRVYQDNLYRTYVPQLDWQ